MQKRHRIFIAINLPEDVKRELAKYQEKWPELPAKWTNKNQLHITLEFLGDLTDVEIGDVCKIVGEVTKQHKLFSVDLNKIIYGPPKKMPPRMVWAGGEKSEELAELKQDLQEYLLKKISYRPEGRGFTPHITLARISEWEFRKIEPEERPEVNEDIDFVVPVESIEIMESELKRGGPSYTILESHNLEE
ncbi:MAG: RNA 2',3'-cyclic phosphodiesterase [Patescibacteria group bacterium]